MQRKLHIVIHHNSLSLPAKNLIHSPTYSRVAKKACCLLLAYSTVVHGPHLSVTETKVEQKYLNARSTYKRFQSLLM